MSGNGKSKGRQLRRLAPTTVVMLAALTGLSGRIGGCQDGDRPLSVAKQIASRSELIGGPSALGEVGDYLLENDRIRVVVQGPGFSRGFGVYGGSLIDADLVRPVGAGNQLGGQGRDQFGELFPIFFLEALVPDKVEVLADGADGGAAQVRVSGTGGDFLTMTRSLNQAVLNSHIIGNVTELLNPDLLDGAPKMAFEAVYELAPGDSHVTIKTTLTNIASQCEGTPTDCSSDADCAEGVSCQPVDLPIPSQIADQLLGLLIDGEVNLEVPLGHVVLFGAGNDVFVPEAGYNIRFSLEDSYEAELPFPALPGLLTNVLATSSSNGVSYGFMSSGEVPGFANQRLDDQGNNLYELAYPGVEVDDNTMLMPFLASSFTGLFYAQAPKMLPAGESFTFTSRFIVGDGDVSSVMDTVYDLRGIATETLMGQVRDEITGSPVGGASVVVYDAQGKAFNQFTTNAAGRFRGQLPPGSYSARVEVDPGLGQPVEFSVGAGGKLLNLLAPSPGFIHVRVRDTEGRDLPAKVTAVGTINPADAGKRSFDYLFDLTAGQSWRSSDLIPDDPQRLRGLEYVETYAYTTDGAATLHVRPGKPYTVYISRGLEYDVQKATVRVEPGQTEVISTVLTRVVDTTGYIAADFHLHAAPSLDSSLSLERRVRSCMGEGLEFLVSTDHNFVTDYRPTIEALNMTQWGTSMVGLELTTLEAGHFNGFPVRRDVGKITRGSFEWSLSSPDEIFSALRGMGKYGPDNTVIQVNHARDSILGYFAQHGISSLDPEVPVIKTGGFDLGAIAATNGPSFRRFLNDEGQPCDPDGDDNTCALRSTFSFNFDAMEVFNGKLSDQIRHFRMPESVAGLDLPEETLAQLPAPGTILCDGDEVAFPGMVDDWFNLLNKGHFITGMGNSDSHNDDEDEAGFPRTYVFVGNDDPAFVDDLDVVRGIQQQRAIATNGPFVELFVNGEPIGSRVRDTDGQVEVHIRIQAAPWVDVSQGHLILNGERIETFPVAFGAERIFDHFVTLDMDKDSWLVAEVEGFQSLFPVVVPLELAPIDLTDAVGSLAGAFGFGASELGELEPNVVRPVTPYAITNPIFVLTQGDEFQAPGLPRRECDGLGVKVIAGESKPSPGREESPQRQLKRLGYTPSLWFPRHQGDTHDVRVLFDQFMHHSH